MSSVLLLDTTVRPRVQPDTLLLRTIWLGIIERCASLAGDFATQLVFSINRRFAVCNRPKLTMNQKTPIFCQKSTHFGPFLDSARFFLTLGWSIIPLFGDANPARAKSPALSSWKPYQSRFATDQELLDWSQSGMAQASGIVLGALSGLAVLDIDDPQLDTLFRRCCPDLAETLVVVSGNRGLPHYYFRLPAHLRAGSRNVTGWNISGADFKAEGGYVVAPGSVIAGRCWQVREDMTPRILSEADLSRLEAFARLASGKMTAKRAVSDSGASDSVSGGRSRPAKLTAAILRRRYRSRAEAIGRNNALFEMTCHARDHGWSEAAVAAALVAAHITQPAPSGHRPEPPHRREAEARATISSAFKREPRPVRHLEREVVPTGLPNYLREALLQAKQDRLARVLDALLMAGFRPGDRLSPATAYAAIGDMGVGRNAIYAALKESLPDGRPAFERDTIIAPPAPPPAPAAAGPRCAEPTQNCVLGRVANQGKNGSRMGRPQHVHRMPDPVVLCAAYGVEPGFSDPLEQAAFESPAAYRRALHIALLERAPGHYSRGWLSRRLGVSFDTCRRYERHAGVAVEPSFLTWELHQGNVAKVLPDEPEWGQFLADSKGQRYPALVPLARRLLKAGVQLMFCHQGVNRYGREMSPLVTKVAAAEAVPAGLLEAAPEPRNVTTGDKTTPAVPNMPPLRNVTIGDKTPGAAPPLPLRPVARIQPELSLASPAPERRNVTNGDKTTVFTGDEGAVVEALYMTLRSLNPARALTRKKAASLVATYGAARVEHGRRLIERKRGLRNPAGYLLAWLRRAAGETQTPARDDPAAWLAKLAQSPYADFIANGGDLLAR